MKTNQQILDLINVKLGEHNGIMEQLKKDLELSRQKMAEIATLKPGDRSALFTQTNLVMVLKDRLMFHKAATLVYKDLIDEIQKE